MPDRVRDDSQLGCREASASIPRALQQRQKVHALTKPAPLPKKVKTASVRQGREQIMASIQVHLALDKPEVSRIFTREVLDGGRNLDRFWSNSRQAHPRESGRDQRFLDRVGQAMASFA